MAGINAIAHGWDAWLAAQGAPLSTPVRWIHAPPWPYGSGTGQTWPFVLILPMSQHRARYSNMEVRYEGLWRLMYCDLVSNYGSSDLLLEAATTWCETLATTLQSSQANRSLNGVVDYLGESESGAGGITIAFDQKQSWVNEDELPAWGLPVDVEVRGLPEPG